MRNFTIKRAGWLFTVQKLSKKQQSNIESLSPKIITDSKELEKIQPYLDEIENALSASNITNIAVAGSYGSGKSTIIKTFQSLHPQYDYLNISLASFKDNGENRKYEIINEEIEGKSGVGIEGKSDGGIEGEEDSIPGSIPVGNSSPKEGDRKIKNVNNNLERRLEISILQQIFYAVKPSQIPDSRFKRIRNTTKLRFSIAALCFVVWLISAVLFCFSDNVSISKIWKWEVGWKELIAGVIFLVGLVFLLRLIIRFCLNSKINKVNIKGELELGSKIDNSVFNQHLEEIIYFFETTKYDVVVIEDLDRFQTTDIFTKLRELSIILNNSKLINRRIKFIYAVRDEMFTDKNDRVKFFDYIIPIIPFINASNADTQLNRLIDSQELDQSLSKDFVQDIVTFIDDIDMRLLINIFHEFCIYKKLIKVEILDNLFAIIVYKNMYPADFGLLAHRQGNLYEFISNKSKYIEELVAKIDKQIKSVNDRINDIENETLSSIKELRSIYVLAIQKAIPSATSLILDNNAVTFPEAVLDDNFKVLQSETAIQYNIYYESQSNFYRTRTDSINISFADIEHQVNDKFSYEDRTQHILNKSKETQDKLRNQLAELKTKKTEIESWSIQEVFEEVDPEAHLANFSNNLLMRHLLLNGYINEDYSHYITIFHAGILTQEDYEFERKVKSGMTLPIDFQLNQIGDLIKRIPDKYFKRDVILNINLLDHLLNHKNQYQVKLKNYMLVLIDPNERAKAFTVNFIKSGKNVPQFIKELCSIWSGWWDSLREDNSNSDEVLSGYLKLIVDNADLADIVRLDANKKLSEYIQNKSDFISIFETSKYTKVKQVVKELNVRFNALDAPDKNTKDVFDYIYDNYLYAINYDNIVLMIDIYSEEFKNFKEIASEQSNYTQIEQSKCKKLSRYIEENIVQYIDEVLWSQNIINESEDAFVRLLNNEILVADIKTGLIKRQSEPISELSSINDISVQKLLLEQVKVYPIWHNVITYYKKLETKEIDDTLLSYISHDSITSRLSTQQIKEVTTADEKLIKEFSLKLIYCNEFSYDVYVQIMNSVASPWNGLGFDELDEDKVEWMVDTKFLTLTASNFDKLKEHFPDQHIVLIEKHQDEFIAEYDEFTFEVSDIQKLLTSTTLIDSVKVNLIEKLNSEMLSNKEVSKSACKLLSEGRRIELGKESVIGMMSSINTVETKIKLLNQYVDLLDNTELQQIVTSFGGEYARIFLPIKRPTFTRAPYNLELFKVLQQREMINKINPSEKGGLVRVYAKH